MIICAWLLAIAGVGRGCRYMKMDIEGFEPGSHPKNNNLKPKKTFTSTHFNLIRPLHEFRFLSGHCGTNLGFEFPILEEMVAEAKERGVQGFNDLSTLQGSHTKSYTMSCCKEIPHNPSDLNFTSNQRASPCLFKP